MQDVILVDEPLLCYADVEDGCVFLIQSVLVRETSKELEPVWSVVGDRSPTMDFIETNPMYLYGKARLRSWRLHP